MAGTVDLATLAIAIDSTQARVAALELDKLTSASKKTEDQTKKTASASEMASAGWDKIRSAAALAAKAFAVVEGALAVWVVKVIESTAAMKDLALQAGTTAEGISKFELPAKLAGSSTEAVSHAMFMMTKALKAAEDPLSDASLSFKAIGIDAQTLKDKSPDEIFLLLAKRLNMYSEGAGKNRVMLDLLARSGYEMSKVMKEVAEATTLTSSVTNAQAEAADKLTDTWTETFHILNQHKRELLDDLTPSLQNISNAVKQAAIDSNTWTVALVALGGALAYLLGLENARTEIQEYNKEIVEATKKLNNLYAVLDAGPGFLEKLFNADQTTNIKAAIADIEAYIATMKRYRDSLVTPPEKPPTKPGLNPQSGEDAKKLMKDLEESQKTYDAIMNKASGLEADYADKVEDLIFLWAKKKITLDQFNVALRTYASQQPGVIQLEKDWNDTLAAAIKIQEALSAQRETLRTSVVNYERTLEDTISDMKFENSIMEESAVTQQKMNALRKIDIDLRNAIRALPLPTVESDAATQDYIDAMNRLKAAAAAAKEAIPSLIDANVKLQEQRNWWAQIGDVALNFFEDLFEHGKSAFGNLWTVVKKFFAQMVALFATRFVLSLAAGAMSGAAGSALAGVAGSLGAGTLAGGSLGGLSAAGAGIADFSSGLAGTYTGSELGGSFLGELGSTISSAIGAIPVWGQIALAIGALVAIFSGKGGGPKTEGAYGAGLTIRSGAADPAMQQFATTAGSAFATALQQFGIAPNGLNFGFGSSRDPSGTAPSFVDWSVMNAAGGVVASGQDHNVGRSDEEFNAAVALALQRATLAAFQNSELPAAIKDILMGANASTGTAAEITAVFTAASTAQQHFAAQWADFESMFNTDAENLAAAQAKVAIGFASLGIAIPTSSAEFAKIVHGLDTTTTEGRKTFDSLMALAPAFKYVEDASAAAAQAIKDQWGDVQDSLDAILGRDRTPGQISAMLGQLDGPFKGLDLPALAALVAGFSEDQWAALTDSQRTLIRSILNLGSHVQHNTSAVIENTVATGQNSGWIEDGSTAAGAAVELNRNIREWLHGLSSSALHAPGQRLDVLSADWDRMLAAAQGGDTAARGGITGLGQQIIDLARETYGSSSKFWEIYDRITRGAAGVAGTDPTGTDDVNPNRRIAQALPTGGDRLASQRDLAAVAALLERIAGPVEDIADQPPPTPAPVNPR